MKKTGILLGFLAIALLGMSQGSTSLIMTEANNGQTFSMQVSLESYFLQIYPERDGTGQYIDNVATHRWVTIDSGSCDGETAMSLYFESFDIDPSDTLIIHDGPSLSSPRLLTCNNNLNPQFQTTIFPSLINTTGKLTLEFITNGDGNNGSGFSINVACREKCETVTPVIDTFFFKTRNGVIVDTGYTRMVQVIDTNWSADSTSFYLDTQYFRGVHLCLGEGIIFAGHGEYTNHYGYMPSDYVSQFDWNFGNGDDTSGICLQRVPARYRDLDCYDVTLSIIDSRGCKSTIYETVKVRVAQNPLKTIFDLNPICTTDSLIVNIGYEGAGATITLTTIEFQQTKSRSIDCKTFIPDGASVTCEQGDAQKCFTAPIFFDDFPSGKTVQSAADICSVCINMEHEYLGDIRGQIICPTGQKSILWYGTKGRDPLVNDSTPQGTYGGGGRYLGLPYGGNSHHTYDEKCGNTGANDKCDSICNMFDVGFDYCFSKNKDYTLRTGDKCDKLNPVTQDYFCYTTGDDTNISNYQFITIPAPFALAGQTAAPATFPTKLPSKHDGKFDYYMPAQDFSQLIGCPLNGEWKIQLCDNFGSDNGWIFSWMLDFCGISSGTGCEYQVAIDSVIWTPDSAYGDFDLGHWRGVNVNAINPVKSVITSFDTAGYFPINVKIYDEFGCVWDTVTSIHTVWAPTPVLGDSVLICDVETVVLDAKDRHTPITNQTFTWEPFGQTTDTIHTHNMLGSSTLYTVEVENNEQSITCRTRDSVRVNINHQPLPNFDPGVYPLEGCEPYTIHFENTSQYGNKYTWVFGDGDTSHAESPTHTYGTGQYDFKYFVASESGCNDSLVYSKLITVYSSPVARFSWEPMNPTVMHPSVTFQNLTIPQSDDNKYFWEIQYDRDNDISYHTMTDVNPTFEWETDGSDISGNYIARLIAMTRTMGPSGNVVECRDTVESSILLVNDFLQFPNAVTPNGDGVNDKFIIRNLVEGLGYPNNSLAIYDRWGKRVFYKENISKEEDFWDPAADNIPAGTYFWRFVGKGYLGDIHRNGVVEVIK